MKKIKRRYLLALLFLVLYGTCQMEFLTLRKPEKDQADYLHRAGVDKYYFGRINLGSVNIHYTHTGKDSLGLVLFVHGSPGSSADMLRYLTKPALQSCQLIAVDRPGFGYSAFGRAEPSLGRQAECLAALLRKYPFRPSVLVGHSYGGPVIGRVAMDYPELVDGMVIIAGALDPRLEPHYWWQKPLNWPIIENLLPPVFRVSNQEILPLKSELEAMADRWGEINCAVTVVQGLKDKLVHPENYLFAKTNMVNAEWLTIDTMPNDGHFILWTKEDEIVKHILQMVHKLSIEHR